LILDEAHHAAPSSGAKYAIDSRITKAIRDLAPRFEHRLFLSATPHNGHSNSFSALLEILDPQRFTRGVKVLKSNLDGVMVRRLKEDLRELVGGFPRREPVQIDLKDLSSDTPELKLAKLLDDYRKVRQARMAGATRRKQAEAALLVSHLQQRLLRGSFRPHAGGPPPYDGTAVGRRCVYRQHRFRRSPPRPLVSRARPRR
jgi:hypothetical protein